MILGWRVIRVRGASMAPALRSGDLVLGRRFRRPPGSCSVGSIACIQHQGLGLIIKRLIAYDEDGFRLRGDGATSAPSMDLGVVRPEQILGRVVWRLPRMLLAAGRS